MMVEHSVAWKSERWRWIMLAIFVNDFDWHFVGRELTMNAMTPKYPQHVVSCMVKMRLCRSQNWIMAGIVARLAIVANKG